METIKTAKWQIKSFERPSANVSIKLMRLLDAAVDGIAGLIGDIDHTGISRDEIYKQLIYLSERLNYIDMNE